MRPGITIWMLSVSVVSAPRITRMRTLFQSNARFQWESSQHFTTKRVRRFRQHFGNSLSRGFNRCRYHSS
jgi:hypothetical protein